jgi:indole-3-glycerol phosphate synthase
VILDEIVAHKRVEVAEARERHPIGELQSLAEAAPPRRDYAAALGWPALDRDMRLIAEIKRASPSKGVLRQNVDLLGLVASFVAGGAHAISVLTDERFFGGTLEDLHRVTQYGSLPALRKDFLIDPYQVYEAALAGASSALLIVGIVDDAELSDLIALQRSLGMEPQVEVHDETEVERAIRAGARIIGVNNRDLRTFHVDLATTERLRPRIPSDCILVSESGIHRRADVERLRRAGVQVVHIGESLMTSNDPALLIRQLLGPCAS